jgi:GT2 family glycosyltransferase
MTSNLETASLATEAQSSPTDAGPVEYSFLIVNFNMAGLVLRLIENLRVAAPGGAVFEIIIADNSVDPDMRLRSEDLPAGVRTRLVFVEPSRGFVAALNEIIPLARGRWVMIVHPDVELRTGCLAALSSFLQAHPRAGVLGPDLFYPDGTPNKIRLRSPTTATEVRRFLNQLTHILTRRKLTADEILWDRLDDVSTDTVMSVCMLIRREALEAIGRIDPRLVSYYSNDYLCHRVRKLGWTCHYTLSAQAIHFERFAPKGTYSESEVMAYKRSTIAANPRMRLDYFNFLFLCYPLAARIALRAVALAEDSVQLVAQLKQPVKRRKQFGRLWASVLIDLGLRRAA